MKQIIFLFLFTSFCGSQNSSSSFFVKIPNNRFVPVVSHSQKDKKINKTRTGNRKLNKLLNAYKIYDVKKAFSDTEKETLKNIYLISCDDLNLMHNLNTYFKSYYPIVFHLKLDLKKMYQLPALPNDYILTKKYLEVDQGESKGSTITDQDELNYVRAPEAWQVTEGSSDIIIGISDKSYAPEHEDLKNKITPVFGKNHPNSSYPHGSYVASVAAAETNNGKGMTSIGNKSHIYMANNKLVEGVDSLSKIKEVKVISTAWVTSSSNAPIFKKAFDRGKVIVAAAGNGIKKGANPYIYPAAFKNVISVSGIGHHNSTFIRSKKKQRVLEDTHQQNKYHKHTWAHHSNDSVDIVAPSYGILLAKSNDNGKSTYANEGVGTSYAAPMVSGAIALMFDVNYCLKPKEVESILKLTAIKIDTLPQNKAFYGKLGAGKLDAYRAVKMAKDMSDKYGTVEIKDRILYRWFYKLETAPYNIRMKNNDITENARLKFKARHRIKLESGHYYPKKDGYINLKIDKDLTLNNCSPRPNFQKKPFLNQVKHDINNALFDAAPISFDNNVTISKKEKTIEDMSSIIIYNVFGKKIHEEKNINSNRIEMDLEYLENGVYFVKIYNSKNAIIGVKKIFRN